MRAFRSLAESERTRNELDVGRLLEKLGHALNTGDTSQIEEIAACASVDSPEEFLQWVKNLLDAADPKQIDKITARTPVDSPVEIERRLKSLADDNELSQLFGIGRQFGQILGMCHVWEVEGSRAHADDPEVCCSDFYDGFQRDVTEIAQQLCNHTKIKECSYAATFFANLGRDFLKLPRNRRDYAAGEIPKVSWSPTHVRYNVSLALGELLGTLKGADMEVHDKDARSATPRMFAVSKDASAERVGGQLLLMEREMNARTGTGMFPENVVSMLSNSIEALAKQVWPKEFAAFGSSVEQVLRDKMRSGSELEKKFASHAFSLHKTYRNAATHELATYECTWEEARYFFQGIRVLYDLHKKMNKD